jgi:parvulin-like peptidyl-prolyl isomerase
MHRFVNVICSALVLSALCLSLEAQQKGKKNTPIREPLSQQPASKPRFQMRGTDIMAIVEGKKITRRELAYLLLQTDKGAVGRVGNALAERWMANRGASYGYSLSDIEIYAAIFFDEAKNESISNALGNLVVNRLVEIIAARQGVHVTQAQVHERAREIFEETRQRLKLTLKDAEILRIYNVPKELFYADLRFRLLGERLLANEIGRRNGHPIQTDDWAEVRSLFVAADPTEKNQEAAFAAARKRIEGWLREIKDGRPMEEVARRNEDNTNSTDGLRGPALRGTGSKHIEAAIYRLRPGDKTPPLRGDKGWYVFRMERLGTQIAPAERQKAWRQVVEARMNPFLTELARNANIKSRLSLPFQKTVQKAPDATDPSSASSDVGIRP